MKVFVYLVILLSVGMRGLSADVKLSGIFGDHMVLQQDGKIPVWGTAAPGEAVKVSIGASEGQATADGKGDWRVDLPSLPTSSTGQTLTVTGKNTLIFQDVLIGDVWIGSGQSNMGLNMRDITRMPGVSEAIASADNPQIRLFYVVTQANILPQKSVSGTWQVCTPATAAGFSAVLYYYGRQAQAALHRPIGLIESSWPGSYIQSWIALDVLKSLPGTADGIALVQKKLDAFPKDAPGRTVVMDDYQARLKDWQANVDAPYRAAVQKWQTEADAAKAAGQPVPDHPVESAKQPIAPDGSQDGEPLGFSTIFNGIINPLIPYAMKGFLWYQGEANAMNIDGGTNDDYRALLTAMISDWRARWQQGDFPFLVVGLANFGTRFPVPTDSGWARIREAQAQVVDSVPNTALAEAIDIGEADNIHPADKLDLGNRLFPAGFHVAYGQNVPDAGPSFDSMTVEGNNVRIKFRNVGSGLTLGAPPHLPAGSPAPSTTDLTGFAVAGADQKWVFASAKIDGNEVVVSGDQLASAPVAVRYGWAQNPAVNLYNKEGFPAVPFRTDTWPMGKSTP